MVLPLDLQQAFYLPKLLDWQFLIAARGNNSVQFLHSIDAVNLASSKELGRCLYLFLSIYIRFRMITDTKNKNNVLRIKGGWNHFKCAREYHFVVQIIRYSGPSCSTVEKCYQVNSKWFATQWIRTTKISNTISTFWMMEAEVKITKLIA